MPDRPLPDRTRPSVFPLAGLTISIGRNRERSGEDISPDGWQDLKVTRCICSVPVTANANQAAQYRKATEDRYC